MLVDMSDPIRPYPWKCGTCREKAVWPINVDYTAEMRHDGAAYQVTVPGLEVLECRACQARMLSDEALDKLNEALRRQAGLLAPEDIKRQREAIGLSQQELADYLQIPSEIVSRWETGAQIQQRTMNRHLAGLFQVPELRKFYQQMNEMAANGAARTIETVGAGEGRGQQV